MSQTLSEGSAKPYGVERVCDVWEQARSTFYDRQERVQKLAQGIKPGKRGPKPSVSDSELLDLIRRDLAASPFQDEGHRKVWVFAAVEHWNAECVAGTSPSTGDRYVALEPISQGLTSLYGSVAAEVARGLLLRMDHGSQYLSDHFVNQVRSRGIKPCFAFVEQPQTNGVVERFNRTLKEQAIYGKVLRNIEEVRRAVGKFVKDYNAEWRVEKNGFVSPRQAWQAWFAALSQHAT